jgi:hypothetical protein
VLLTFLLIGSLLVGATPVSAGTLNWSDQDLPDELEPGTDIVDMAIGEDGENIYVVTGDTPEDTDVGVFRSSNAGRSWTEEEDSDFDDYDLWYIAVAPDDDDIVVVAAEDGGEWEVFVSTNGADSFGATDFWEEVYNTGEMDEITDIAVSPESSGDNIIGVCGYQDGTAAVWYWELGDTTPEWTNAGDDGDEEADGFYDVLGSTTNSSHAIAFSPGFPGDQIMVVVTLRENCDGGEPDLDGDDAVTLDMFTFNTDKWNEEAGFDDYPAIIVSDSGIDWIDSASMSLDPEYLGSDEGMRTVFVGLTIDQGTSDDNSGLYRMDDTDDEVLEDDVEIHSVAFDGTNLLAGRFDNNYTYYSDDPMSSDPTVSTTRKYKRPGGEGSVLVGWADDEAVAATGYDWENDDEGEESCFAVSEDMGATWTDISFIDTELDELTDVDVSSDGAVTYLASISEDDDLSIWRMGDDDWVRVLSVLADDLNGDYFLIRTAPDDPDVIYVCEYGGDGIFYSSDGGAERWQSRTCRYDIQDLAVEGEGDVSYVIIEDNGEVSKSSNSGFTWGSSEDTGLDNGWSIASIGEDMVLAGGGEDGNAAWSTDGGDSWDDVGDDLGEYVVVAATGLEDGEWIFGASQDDGQLYRYEIGEDDDWDDFYSIPTNNADEDDFWSDDEGDVDADYFGIFGIVYYDSVLYAVGTDCGTDSVTLRSINPTADSPAVDDELIEGEALFDAQPRALKVSTGSTKLWALDTLGDPDDDDVDAELYAFTDPIGANAPAWVSPVENFVVKTNPVTGRAVMVSFIWESPADNIEGWDLEVAFDPDFDEVVWSDDPIEEDADEGDTVTVVMGPYSSDYELEWTFDQDYYARVRVAKNMPARSQWSEIRSFSIATVETQPPVDVEIPPTPEIIVEVPPPTEVNIPPAPPAPEVPAPVSPAWIWAVVIIGALLFIVLIIFIIRTRRP